MVIAPCVKYTTDWRRKSISKTSNEVKDRWKAANYTRVNIYLPKEDAAAYKAKCNEKGLSLSDVPKQAIYEFLGDN